MSKGINKNIVRIIDQINSDADNVHKIKTTYTSPKKDKKQKQMLDDTWNNKCHNCGKAAHIKITQSNDNGNQGKPFGHCHECNLFLGFITDSYFRAATLDKEERYNTSALLEDKIPPRARSPPLRCPSPTQYYSSKDEYQNRNQRPPSPPRYLSLHDDKWDKRWEEELERRARVQAERDIWIKEQIQKDRLREIEREKEAEREWLRKKERERETERDKERGREEALQKEWERLKEKEKELELERARMREEQNRKRDRDDRLLLDYKDSYDGAQRDKQRRDDSYQSGSNRW